jgi:hypothetical protein
VRAIILTAVLTLVSCAAPASNRAADFPDDMPSCIGDDDCVISTFTSCCGCAGPERVLSRVEQSRREGCPDIACGPEPECPSPPARRWKRAACEHGRCVGKVK